MEIIIACLILFVLIYGYFFPVVLAYQKKRKNKVAILMTVLLFGWTGIGWAGALIWSMMED